MHFKQLRLAELEKRAVNDMFVILSDIWLDNEEVVNILFIEKKNACKFFLTLA